MKTNPQRDFAKTDAATAILTLAVFARDVNAELQFNWTTDANVGTVAVQLTGAPNAPIENARTGTKDTLPNARISAQIGKGELQFAYSGDETTGPTSAKRATTTVGYVHSLSNRVDL